MFMYACAENAYQLVKKKNSYQNKKTNCSYGKQAR